MRLTAFAATLIISAAPLLAADVIETDQMIVYEGQWVQSKLAEQNGALMFLTVPRGQIGEYFSISCILSGGTLDRTIKLGFPDPLASDSAPVMLRVGDIQHQATATFTGTTPDPAYTKSDIHSYALRFTDEATESAVFDAMRKGSELQISGQQLPIDLTGFTAAYNGQTAYCR
ncbi:hypothetical protein [Pseudooceanicola sp.]|uniref:hypothetical protein n=1 Tax=Pseudooceanicola sp. TaxID=1914328 RepID=UPI00262D78FD|nr:hypothetical protein [Pseudooceanicola sp.]MDF1857236.1 hypothetical protein [Pseudooceanicola sp.]